MRTALLQYPFHSAVKLIVSLLVRRGYKILSYSREEGIIKAATRGGLFRKSIPIEIRVRQKDQHLTNVDISVNLNQNIYEKPSTSDEFMEEKLLDIIYHYF